MGARKVLSAAGERGMTITEVYGTGVQPGSKIHYRGAEQMTDYVPRVKLKILVDDEAVDDAVEASYQHAYTGEVGDGRIFVSNLVCVLRIRTGEVEASPIEYATSRRY